MSDQGNTVSNYDASSGSEEQRSNVRSQILPYVLGELSEAEEKLLERSAATDPIVAKELADSMETLTILAEQIASGMPAPRRALKERILAAATASGGESPAIGSPTTSSAVSSQSQFASFPFQAGTPQHIVRDAEPNWLEDPSTPGVAVKILFKDPATDVFTVLARLAPGASYPPHRHVGQEQCYVISGDLHVDGIDLVGGDYISTVDGTPHEHTYSNDGCLLLLTTRLADKAM